ncbi:uncharacterized protein [Eucyclogobius newberryi]|uniref:uncharacterized protein n=1 Tax=Eucyclogobius newberryi TaxID=166745 RepID=UPI003B5B3BD5
MILLQEERDRLVSWSNGDNLEKTEELHIVDFQPPLTISDSPITTMDSFGFLMTMSRSVFLQLFFNLLLCSTTGLLSGDSHRQAKEDEKQDKAILEMLHIDKISASVHGKPHPYMRRLYQQLNSPQAQDLDGVDETLVQSLRMRKGPDDAPNGWIWFTIAAVPLSRFAADLVLFRKTVHPHPLNVTVTLHALTLSRGAPHQSAALEERLLSLDQRHPSGYDVFDVSDTVAARPGEMIGFQLRYRDESGSLVLHDALTHSLYCMDRGALREPILVLYRSF